MSHGLRLARINSRGNGEETLKRISQSSQPTITLIGEALSHHVPDVVIEERS